MAVEKTARKRLVILDSHAILHRAYHALPDFSTQSGEPTGGLYGLAAMLIRIINDLKPDYIIAAYDRAEPTFRKQVYDNYKASRPKTDEGLVKQIIRSRDIFTAFNIPIYDVAGFEADDIIGTAVEQLKDEKDLQIIIASGDMDTLQLVDDNRVTVYTLKKGINDTILYDEDKVRERYGFDPALLVDYKGLRGDPSDNIIGIAGIGEKTATTLIKEFGTIEDIYKKLKKDEKAFLKAGLTARIIKLLKEGEEEALFSKTLATIRRDAPAKIELSDKPWRETLDQEKLEKLFAELEFKSLLARLKNLNGELVVAAPEKTVEIDEGAALAAWLLDSRRSLSDPLPGSKEKLLEQLKLNNLEKVYRDIELPLIPIIRAAEARGVLVDVAYLKKLSQTYHARLTKLEKQIYAAAGTEFNLNSPKQLGEVLFDRLQLTAKGLKKTAGGARSTRESELLKLKEGNPIITDILDYRELQKLLSTYIDNIPQQVDSHNRLHTHLNQAGSTTGRMSSDSPNMQNIPASGELGLSVRRGFIASPGFKWTSFDYSQIEMRVLALLSADPGLTKIFQSGEDVHTGVASTVFSVSKDEVTKEMRRRAKVINFGIIYGMGVNALRQNLGSTREEAQNFYDGYFAAFPKIRAYFEGVKDFARHHGYTETLFGRRRYFSDIKSHQPMLRAAAERMAMNAPLQGTAADIVKMAMIKVDQKLKSEKLDGKVFLLLQVHDELVYEISDNLVDSAVPLIKETMESAASTSIHFAVSAAVATNWAETK